MDSKLSIVNPVSYNKWDTLLLSLRDYSFFYCSAWAAVLNKSYQYTPTYFTLLDNGNIVALAPFMDIKSILTGHRGVSLPFTDYCEPLIKEDIQFKDLFDQVVDYGKKAGWKSIELRGGQDLLGDALPYTTYFGHTLYLSPKEEGIFSLFKDSTRRNIKKAISQGVEVKVLNSLESVKEFFRLNCITRRYHGLPPQPYRFFKNVYDHIISRNLGLVVVAYFNGNAVAGAVYFHFGEKAVYKYGASDRNHQHLRANNLVMWEAIRWYCRNGYTSLCFGRTESDNHGLRRFKIDWGTKERVIHYYKHDLERGVFMVDHQKRMKFFNKVFSKTPLCLLNTIGSSLYRHVG